MSEERKRKAKEVYETIANVLPEVEAITINGKSYTVNYKQYLLMEDYSPEGYTYPDGQPVNDTDESQLIIDEIEYRIYEAYITTKGHCNG